MPEQFKSNAGGLMAGHSDKWSDKNRRSNSHNAGAGRAGSRNQGTGAAGKANTVATDTIDTTKMTPDEKLKYFNSLGLLKPQQAKPDAHTANKPQQTQDSTPKTENPVKVLSDRLGKVFSTKPEMLQDIVKHLQSIPKEQLKQKALDIISAMKDNSSTDPNQVHGAIMSVLNDDVDFDNVESNDLQSIKDFFHMAGKEDRKRPEDVDGLIGRFMDRVGNDPAKIAKAKAALDKVMQHYVPGERSKYITGMNAAFGALNN